MGARGDFRHHAAERRMVLDLRVHDVGQNAAGTVVGAVRSRRRRSRRRWSRCPAPAFDANSCRSSLLPSPENRRLPVPGEARAKTSRVACEVQKCNRPRSSRPQHLVATIGTRGSPLALAQANEVRRRLAAAHGVGRGTASRSRSSRPRATRSRTGRCMRPAARACSPRRSSTRCWRARSTLPCIRPRTCRPSCRTGCGCRHGCRARIRATSSSASRRRRLQRLARGRQRRLVLAAPPGADR